MKNRLLAYILVYFPLVYGCAQVKDSDNISVEELKAAMQTDSTLVILDVRTPRELTGPLGQIDGVVNIPVQELEKRVGEMEQYKSNNIAVICRSGNRSRIGTTIMLEHGFKAKNVLGGMKAWNKMSAHKKE